MLIGNQRISFFFKSWSKERLCSVSVKYCKRVCIRINMENKVVGVGKNFAALITLINTYLTSEFTDINIWAAKSRDVFMWGSH